MSNQVTIKVHMGINGSHVVSIERSFSPNGETIATTLLEVMQAAMIAAGQDPTTLLGEGQVLQRSATVLHPSVGAEAQSDPGFAVPEGAEVVVDQRHSNA